ncbi:hypothetical protein [Raoultibacter phocaeensis]|uniref:hypothetical protein n=1 Tax=Raoultibacter phocaeensis TaxID=2479841 RepID=UPI00111A63D8|nr:hypothetical protein [Raoultibacter phocaeensis]
MEAEPAKQPQHDAEALERALAVDAESSATGIMRLVEIAAASDQPLAVKACPPPGVGRSE